MFQSMGHKQMFIRQNAGGAPTKRGKSSYLGQIDLKIVKVTAMASARFIYDLRSNMYPVLIYEILAKKPIFWTGTPGPHLKETSCWS